MCSPARRARHHRGCCPCSPGRGTPGPPHPPHRASCATAAPAPPCNMGPTREHPWLPLIEQTVRLGLTFSCTKRTSPVLLQITQTPASWLYLLMPRMTRRPDSSDPDDPAALNLAALGVGLGPEGRDRKARTGRATRENRMGWSIPVLHRTRLTMLSGLYINRQRQQCRNDRVCSGSATIDLIRLSGHTREE